MRAGFEWFVAWRYLRTRGRRASLAPLLVGLFMVATAAGFFWLGLKEGAKPSFKWSGAPDWRRVHVLIALVAAYVGAAFAVFGALRHVYKTDPYGQERRFRPSWGPPLAGLALLAGSVNALIAAQAGPAASGRPRRLSLIPPVETPTAPWALAFDLAAGLFLAAAAAGLVIAVLRIVRFRRGGGRARSVDEARASGALGPLVGALLLLGFGALLRYALERPVGLDGFALAAAGIEWGRLYQAIGLGSMVLGVLVAVFGLFYSMQSIFTTISNYGVFLGTWALVVALSVMNGFEVDLRQKILGSNAHVLVSKEDGQLTEWRELMRQIEGIPGVVAQTPYKQSEVVIAANSNYAGVIIKGIDPRSVGRVTDLEKNLQHGAKLEKMWPILPDGGVLEYSQRPDAGAGADDDEPPPIFDGAGGEGNGGGAGGEGNGGGAGGEGNGGGAGGEGNGDGDGAPADKRGGASAGKRGGDGTDVAAATEDEPPIDFSGETELADGGSAAAPSIGADADADAGFPSKYLPSRDSELLDLGGLGAATIIEPSPARERPLDPRVADLDGLLVGRELAKNLHLYVGQEVQVVSPLGQDTPAGQVPRVRNFRIAGIFYSGMYEYDTKFAYVTLPALQSFLSLGDETDGIEIKIRDRDDTGSIVRALEERLGPSYRVQDWKELNRSLFSALKLEKIAMFLVLTIIILVASFSIVSNLIMVVVEKAKEIAILKALGASDGGVMRVFMIEGSYIGGLGTLFGITLGVATCLALENFGLPLDPDVYYIDRLPVAMDPVAVALVALAGVAISFVATIYPSYVAARLRPVDGLRYE